MGELREMRTVDKGIDVYLFRRQDVIYADAEQAEEIIFLERRIVVDEFAYQSEPGRNFRLDLITKQEHESVARQMSVRFVFLQDGRKYAGRKSFRVFRDVLAEMFLHVFEIMNIEANERVMRRPIV